MSSEVARRIDALQLHLEALVHQRRVVRQTRQVVALQKQRLAATQTPHANSKLTTAAAAGGEDENHLPSHHPEKQLPRTPPPPSATTTLGTHFLEKLRGAQAPTPVDQNTSLSQLPFTLTSTALGHYTQPSLLEALPDDPPEAFVQAVQQLVLSHVSAANPTVTLSHIQQLIHSYQAQLETLQQAIQKESQVAAGSQRSPSCSSTGSSSSSSSSSPTAGVTLQLNTTSETFTQTAGVDSPPAAVSPKPILSCGTQTVEEVLTLPPAMFQKPQLVPTLVPEAPKPVPVPPIRLSSSSSNSPPPPPAAAVPTSARRESGVVTATVRFSPRVDYAEPVVLTAATTTNTTNTSSSPSKPPVLARIRQLLCAAPPAKSPGPSSSFTNSEPALPMAPPPPQASTSAKVPEAKPPSSEGSESSDSDEGEQERVRGKPEKQKVEVEVAVVSTKGDPFSSTSVAPAPVPQPAKNVTTTLKKGLKFFQKSSPTATAKTPNKEAAGPSKPTRTSDSSDEDSSGDSTPRKATAVAQQLPTTTQVKSSPLSFFQRFKTQKATPTPKQPSRSTPSVSSDSPPPPQPPPASPHESSSSSSSSSEEDKGEATKKKAKQSSSLPSKATKAAAATPTSSTAATPGKPKKKRKTNKSGDEMTEFYDTFPDEQVLQSLRSLADHLNQICSSSDPYDDDAEEDTYPFSWFKFDNWLKSVPPVGDRKEVMESVLKTGTVPKAKEVRVKLRCLLDGIQYFSEELSAKVVLDRYLSKAKAAVTLEGVSSVCKSPLGQELWAVVLTHLRAACGRLRPADRDAVCVAFSRMLGGASMDDKRLQRLSQGLSLFCAPQHTET